MTTATAPVSEKTITFNPVEKIPLQELVIDRRIQRETNMNRARLIADSFDSNQFNPILVARRSYGDRKQVVVDGGHRFRACEILGVPAIPAQVVKVKSRFEEATLFLSVNKNRKAVNPMEEFYVEVNKSSSTDSYKINQYVLSHDLRISGGRGNISFPAELKRAYTKLGDELFSEALTAFVKGTPYGEDYARWIFSGIAALYSAHPDLNGDRLAATVRKSFHKIRDGWNVSGASSGDGMARVVANIIVPFYNKRLGESSKLGIALP